MNEILHIILTGEQGRVRSFVISKRKIKIVFSLSFILSLILILTSLASIHFYKRKTDFKFKLVNLERDLTQTKSENNNLHASVVKLEQDRKSLLQNAVNELDKRSQMIESILRTIGIKIQEEDKEQGSGGPFLSRSNESYRDIISKVDRYLERIKPLPLGFPVHGRITSGFGQRIDPINNKSAFHAGIDIVNHFKKEIKSPADGRVLQKGYNQDYGRYIILDHGNGYRTVFGHLKEVLVESGQKVKRGEIIGLLGSTGRSTGPHLHYEIRYKGRAINPINYINIAKHIFFDQEP